MTTSHLTPSHLYSSKGLEHLHAQYHKHADNLPKDEQATVFESFITHLFGIEESYHHLQQRYLSETIVADFRKKIIQRFILKKDKPAHLPPLADILAPSPYSPSSLPSLEDFAALVLTAGEKNLEPWHGQFIYFMLYPQLRHDYHSLPSWRFLDKAIDPLPNNGNGIWSEKVERQRARQGFDLTDPVQLSPYAMEEAGYCLKCHTRQKDSCRKGLATPLTSKDDLPGCPLDQKISEMFELMEQRHLLTALAIVMIDNPLLALTGHRICNDCQKSCIFQNQTAVNIPQGETRLLLDILSLPYGVEIYSLLTRWNPFHLTPLPLPPHSQSVAIVGMGPAGIGLGYEMLRKGYQVMLFEGLKVDPLPTHLIGTGQNDFDLIQTWSTLTKNLEHRKIKGFGGVAEYGITARWDKNFLMLVRLILERHSRYHYLDGIRIGKTLSIENLIDHGFDHVALCTGAGKPKTLSTTTWPKGVRMGVDFLMGLHQRPLPETLIKNPLTLPAYVYGAGLTAIDTATEVLAAYPVQVAAITKALKENPDHVQHIPQDQLAIFCLHARELAKASTATEKKKLLKAWGGVTVLYHRDLPQAPSYRQSRPEVANALAEGIEIQDQKTLISWHSAGDTLQNITVLNQRSGQQEQLNTRTLFLALGTKPNTNAITDDINLSAKIKSRPLQWMDADQKIQTPTKNPKDPQPFFITFFSPAKAVTALGDLHPTYQGSVVKALASAKYAAPQIDRLLKISTGSKPINLQDYAQSFQATLIKSEQIAVDHIQLTVHAPSHLKQYQLGHFFKIQSYEGSLHHDLKGQAISPFNIDNQAGTFNAIVRGKTRSKHPEAIFLMGPVGEPLKLTENAQVQCMVEDTDYYLLSIMKALEKENKLARYDRVKVQDIKAENNMSQIFNYFFPRSLNLSTQDPTDLLISDPQLTKAVEHQAQISGVQIHRKLGGPLQCMMGGICAHCLKPDPHTPGHWIYACQSQWM
ncbi:MAG: hypothetical protein C0582_02395 [Alphaproteobacteria bacterium]|nr:MAG: hypothetical protein C0582_02395 [Alphaproteobacteria bacterium]